MLAGSSSPFEAARERLVFRFPPFFACFIQCQFPAAQPSEGRAFALVQPTSAAAGRAWMQKARGAGWIWPVLAVKSLDEFLQSPRIFPVKAKTRGGGVSAGASLCFSHAAGHGGGRGGGGATFRPGQADHIWRDGWWPHLEPLQPAMPLLFVRWWAAGSEVAAERESVRGNSLNKKRKGPFL